MILLNFKITSPASIPALYAGLLVWTLAIKAPLVFDRPKLSAISSVIVKDVPPYILVSGNTAKPSGLNREGLKRNGFDANTINLLKKAYRIIYRQNLTLTEALNELMELSVDSKSVNVMRSFISSSERGIVR